MSASELSEFEKRVLYALLHDVKDTELIDAPQAIAQAEQRLREAFQSKEASLRAALAHTAKPPVSRLKIWRKDEYNKWQQIRTEITEDSARVEKVIPLLAQNALPDRVWDALPLIDEHRQRAVIGDRIGCVVDPTNLSDYRSAEFRQACDILKKALHSCDLMKGGNQASGGFILTKEGMETLQAIRRQYRPLESEILADQ